MEILGAQAEIAMKILIKMRPQSDPKASPELSQSVPEEICCLFRLAGTVTGTSFVTIYCRTGTAARLLREHQNTIDVVALARGR